LKGTKGSENQIVWYNDSEIENENEDESIVSKMDRIRQVFEMSDASTLQDYSSFFQRRSS
jgi:hypothetical protein